MKMLVIKFKTAIMHGSAGPVCRPGCFVGNPLLFEPMKSVLSFSLAIVLLFGDALAQNVPPQAPYVWRNVALGGGGNVLGLVLSPKVPDLAYIRTDVGGSYRWDNASQQWIALQDFVPSGEWNLYGAESIAVDPSDPTGKLLYLSAGKYDASWAKTPSVVMKSTDGGATWARTSLQSGAASNWDQAYGERLAIDPHRNTHVLCASRSSGLWRTTDGGGSWVRVPSGPTGKRFDEKDPSTKSYAGLVFVIFDPQSAPVAPSENTGTIYVGACGEGVYQSRDGGDTWSLLSGGPAFPRRAVIDSTGALIVSHSTGLARFSADAWTEIAPAQMKGTGCQAVAVDPRDPNHLLTAPGLPKHDLPVYRTIDGGKTWVQVAGMRNQTVKWWPGWHWFSATASLTFDPHYPNRVWATDWYGIYRTDDITAAKVVWTNYQRGHEEIVTTGALTTLPVGDIKLFSGTADVGGFDHESLTEFPQSNIWAKGFPGGFTCTGIAFQPSNPLFMARVGARDWSGPGAGGYSLDGGKTWTVFPKLPYDKIRGGRVVIAASGPRILWAPQQGEPHFTDDYGQTWTKCESGGELKYSVRGTDVFESHQPLAADGGDPNFFYIFKRGKFWRSEDGGANWKMLALMEDEGTHMIASVPGKAHHVWMSMNFHGLRCSTDGGETWTRLPNVRRAQMFCLGKPAPGQDYPSLFILGAINNTEGYFRSDDRGQTWAAIDLPLQKIGCQPNIMAGDWQVFGRVFVGTNGRGIFYGEPAVMSTAH